MLPLPAATSLVVNILDITTQEGNNALHNAARYGHKLLVQRSSKNVLPSPSRKTTRERHRCMSPPDMKDYKRIHIGKMRDKFGNTPSHGIARNANFKVMAALAANNTESLRRINNMG
ncbi:protein ACCELERATED CELL DEATH 6-like [Gossypium australe]|uniref:Protein ACCELERATED CELL DEATH 6-like n=1 Tax=Gossypium australe TaxID=47621 RepID=A0A5B6VEA0_9ROSI|nr:protein ACCELERATED CELL DEATH 6-like [Gossypium australe]